jgi:fluoride exporter
MAPREPHHHWDLPLDPDLDAVEDVRHRPGAAPEVVARWPQLPVGVLVAVFAGGCVGGLLRYAVVRGWPDSAGSVPWSTLVVNMAGAFVLAFVLVVLARRPVHALARPLVGTGFCGALTTFSSFAVATDELVAHGHAGAAAAYLGLTTVGCLAAAVAGYLTGRAVVPAQC